MFRRRGATIEVLLGHPGGPFWKAKDAGAWSIPKGEIDPDEDRLAAAQREFEEETGIRPDGPYIELGSVRQRAGKTVSAWAFEGDCDPSRIVSNTFEAEWPPRSGRTERFPEIDRAQFYPLAAARKKINPGQAALLDELERRIGSARTPPV